MMLAIPQPGGTRASAVDRYYVTVIPVYGLFYPPVIIKIIMCWTHRSSAYYLYLVKPAIITIAYSCNDGIRR